MSTRTDIMSFDVPGLQDIMTDLGHKPYRGRQLADWLYLRRVKTFEEMDNLPRALRQALEERFSLQQPKLVEKLIDPDGTVRYVLQLGDEQLTETVALTSSGRLTVCFSTQVGCALGCIFCATAKLGLARSLLAGEMLAQLAVVADDFAETRISNVVAMGQGEPFANYEATLSALRMMNSPGLFGVGARHITVSSAGLISQVKRFAAEPEQFTLAISLHSARQRTRDFLMPKLAAQPLDKLREALVYYMAETSRRVSLEYALIEGVNDSRQSLASLLAFCEVPSPGFHVNLLSLNEISEFLPDAEPLKRAGAAAFSRFEQELSRAGISVSKRVSRGESIAAACGQLAHR